MGVAAGSSAAEAEENEGVGTGAGEEGITVADEGVGTIEAGGVVAGNKRRHMRLWATTCPHMYLRPRKGTQAERKQNTHAKQKKQ